MTTKSNCRTQQGRPAAAAPGCPEGAAAIVELNAHRVSPPSTIRSLRPSRSASTCCAVVGENMQEELANVPPPGGRKPRVPRETGGCGTRTAMVSNPDGQQASATGQSASFGSTKVSGPSQNAAASRFAVIEAPECPRCQRTSATWAISVVKEGSPLGVVRGARPLRHWWRPHPAHCNGLGRKGGPGRPPATHAWRAQWPDRRAAHHFGCAAPADITMPVP